MRCWHDKCDLILSALPYDALRTRDVIYSEAYLDWRAGDRRPVIGAPITSELDLEGRPWPWSWAARGMPCSPAGATIAGSTPTSWRSPTSQAAAASVKAGQAVALICDRVDALAYDGGRGAGRSSGRR